MKKVWSGFIVLVILFQGVSVWAAERGTPEYERLVEYKRQQREKRLERKNNPELAKQEGKSFWQKEAERSGFAGTGAMFGNLVKKAVPFRDPNSSKSESTTIDGPIENV